MNIPEGLLYTNEHEWIRMEGNVGYVGITDYAQHQLGDIVFVELPEVDTSVSQGDSIAVVESVKAVANLYSPADGTITSVNEELEDSPELLNQDPYENWIVTLELSDPDNLSELMTAEAYAAFCENLEE
ncbi:MAG: glycine cleavage system protein GcvH [Syntrophomonadaceae bacterium]|jgi:glycine cleavage system H protein|nr:glycine cleavage system protein GcvH [Syntrophomonadaceae bacterium]